MIHCVKKWLNCLNPKPRSQKPTQLVSKKMCQQCKKFAAMLCRLNPEPISQMEPLPYSKILPLKDPTGEIGEIKRNSDDNSWNNPHKEELV